MVGAVSHYTNCGNVFTAAFLYDIIIIERRVMTLATIQAKKRPVIQKGNGYVYNPQTFAKEHKVSNFHVVEDPQELLSLVKPFEFRGRRFITFDTETHPEFPNSHVVPSTVVRRWVGSGKKAVPQDFPFCISICDGKDSYTIFDTVRNGFEKFKQLAPLFEDPSIEKIAHNTKFDMHMFANAGLKIVGRMHDTVVLAKLANENRNSFQLFSSRSSSTSSFDK